MPRPWGFSNSASLSLGQKRELSSVLCAIGWDGCVECHDNGRLSPRRIAESSSDRGAVARAIARSSRTVISFCAGVPGEMEDIL